MAAQMARLQAKVERWRQEAMDRLRPQANLATSETHQYDDPNYYPEAPEVREDTENTSFDNKSPLHPYLQNVRFDPRFQASKLHKYSGGPDLGEFSRSYALAIKAIRGVQNTRAKCFPIALEGNSPSLVLVSKARIN
ncbi:hypothetical protein GUJ93_ZPchr0632g11324 [Zizania palustris]|uniref:Uncharacterized protein n=1 Tax=Zizania palustris TaxID=103762 RepID=A0A8J5RPQ7_ZIZPA|nr:hypothetical protein GUJ93_ZPchr0632g11324 [Zizania palustris]